MVEEVKDVSMGWGNETDETACMISMSEGRKTIGRRCNFDTTWVE